MASTDVPSPLGALEFPSLCEALIRGSGDPAVARNSSRLSPRVQSILAAAVAGGELSDPAWAGSLADYRIISQGFLESLRPISVYDAMLPGMRKLAINVRIASATSAMVGGVPGEGSVIPMTRATLVGTVLDPRMAAGIFTVTFDLLKFSSAAAQSLLGKELRAAVAHATNLDFLSALAVAGTQHTSSGDTADAILHDLRTMLADIAVGVTSRLFLILPSAIVARMALTTTNDGALAFPDLAIGGGQVAGVTVLPTDALPEQNMGLLVDADAIAAAADDIVTVDQSANASLQMSDDPIDGAASLVNMFQTGAVAVRATRFFGYEITRLNSVSKLTGIPVGDSEGTT